MSKQTTQTFFKQARYRQRTNVNSNFSAWVSAGTASVTAVDTVSLDGPVPDYKKRIANYQSCTTNLSGIRHKIQIANNDFTRVIYRHKTIPTLIQETEVEGTLSFHGVNQGVPDPTLFQILSVENQAKIDIVRQIRSANTSLKGLVSAGEFGETLRMVNGAGRQVFRGVGDYLNDVNHFVKTVTPRRLLGTISRRWLEYSFGWKPLLNDIDDGIKGLRRISQARRPRVLVRSKRESVEMNQPTSYSYTLPSITIMTVTKAQRRYGVKFYGCVSISQPQDRVAHEFGFKLDEFIPTIWELIPYSFLSDYFVNIGAIIDAYALNTSGICWLARGDLRSGEIETDHKILAMPAPVGYTSESTVRPGSPFRYAIQKISRAPYFGSLVPSLEFTIPGSGTKWLNIGALVGSHASTSQNVRRSLRL